MKIYAQLNENNICMAISTVTKEIIKENMIEIETADNDYLFRKYENDTWSIEKFEPESTAPITEFQQLKKENTELKKQIETCNASIAELTALATMNMTPQQ